MDDLGAEQLSQLSASCNAASKKSSESLTKFDSSSNGNSSVTARIVGEKDAKHTSEPNSSGCERDGNRSITMGLRSEATCCVASNNVDGDINIGCANRAGVIIGGGNANNAPVDEDSDGKEKTDATPENLKKIVDDVMMPSSTTTGGNNSCANTAGGGVFSSSSPTTVSNRCTNNEQVSESGIVEVTEMGELRIDEDESPSKQALAFTIDFGDGNNGNPAVAAAASQRYRNMVERFQKNNRHRRGASMSKIEDQTTPTTPISGRASRISSAQGVRHQKSSDGGTVAGSEAAKVKMRIRDRSTSGVRDASKRHSWSPRSSTHEPLEILKAKETIRQVEPIRPNRQKLTTSTGKTQMNTITSSRDERSFTPRSTAMQMALNKVEFACTQPPLDDFASKKRMDDDESVSEAGTYTVDGDNYTEEQKELMNIDKMNRKRQQQQQQQQLLTDTGQSRPTDLPLMSSSIDSRGHRRNNVLEISYYHDSTSLKPKISYLEKIKSRVKSIANSPDKSGLSPSDQGQFTSVTTSGVLSKKPTLDSHPRLHRKNSLTKSHIDSSEYVSAGSALRPSSGSSGTKYPSSAFTDHQKAEYKLNVFSKQGDTQHIITEQYSCEATPLDTPESPSDISAVNETGLKTAQTKNDWIQEWARNARARSATVKSTNSEQMSRSFNFENTDDSMLSDPIAYHAKRMDRYRHHAFGDLEYASDTNLSNRKMLPAYDYPNNSTNVVARPPLSPSKIPSPVHTVGRSRTINRPRGSLQDLSPNAYTPETDVYLQKTAVAISNYAQSLSRKNSLQNSPSSKNNSPRRGDIYSHHYHHPSQQHYSADEYSPTHHIHQNSHQQGLHKRHLSHGDHRNNLMSHSLNSDQLNGMLDYRSKQQQQRERQNSFDASMYSPRRMYPPQPLASHHHGNFIEPTNPSIKHQYQQQQQQQQQSPLRRSSSFSNKTPVVNTKGNQQTSNKITQQSRPPHTNKTSIQKSASSTSFRKMYSDYDDNVEYYINDEDDLVDDYCSSDDFDEPNEYYPVEEEAPAVIEQPEPLTNTRYNKALLMRIERSKQKVAGGGTISSASNQAKPPLSGGVIGCPNTPEMPRRAAQNVARSSMRQSVPRDSSLNRLRGEVPNSLASAKKQLLQTASNSASGSASSKKIQPKYMDISKYKKNHTGNFLRKDDTKSTLVATPRNEIKRSPSSASMALNRTDPIRASNRSVKSAGGKPNNTVVKQKENELAMWRRRATYDPMKAAAEGRRKQQEEAKKLTQPRGSESSIVMRSQSFHSGVGQLLPPSLPSSRNHQKILVGNLLGNSNSINSSSNDDDENGDRNHGHEWARASYGSSDDECDDGGDHF